MKKIFHWLIIGTICGLLVSGGWLAYAAISQQVGINGFDSNGIWQPLKTAANGDAQTNTNYLATSMTAFNGATYDRVRAGVNADAQTPTGFLNIALYGFNNATWDRVHAGHNGDGLSAGGMLNTFPSIFNGSTLDRLRSASTTNLTATTSTGSNMVVQHSTWSCTHAPAAATQATCSKAAGGGTVRHVATGLTICASGSADSAIQTAVLRNGATGAGTVLRTWYLNVEVFAGQGDHDADCRDLPVMSAMIGSANTAMTLEFSAAPPANVQQTVTLTGFSVP